MKEVLEIFVEECRKMGTLEESDFSKINTTWESRKPITEENIALAL